MNHTTWLTPIGGTKFVLAVLVLLAGFVLQYAGKMEGTGTQVVLLFLGTAGAFIAGNVAQSRADTLAKRDVEVAQARSGETQP